MPFHIFTPGTTISAADMIDNFNHCLGEGVYPRGNANLELTTSIYDIGSDVSPLSWMRVNNLYYESITNIQFVKAYVEVTSATSRIEITGLNSSLDEMYFIDQFIAFQTAVGSATHVRYFLNGVSSSTYNLAYINSALVGGVATSNRIDTGYLPVGAVCQTTRMAMVLPDSGYRASIAQAWCMGSTTILDLATLLITGGPSDTITSIVITPGAALTFSLGSYIKIMAKGTYYDV